MHNPYRSSAQCILCCSAEVVQAASAATSSLQIFSCSQCCQVYIVLIVLRYKVSTVPCYSLCRRMKLRLRFGDGHIGPVLLCDNLREHGASSLEHLLSLNPAEDDRCSITGSPCTYDYI